MTHDDAHTYQQLNDLDRQAVADLERVLDIDAGLQEILLETRHDTAVAELTDGVLDTEAGLAAILPTPASGPSKQEPPVTSAPEKAARRVIAAIPPAQRLALRPHPATHVIVNATLLTRALDHSPDQDLDHDPDFAVDLARARDLAPSLARGLARALARNLNLARTRARARDLARVLEHYLMYARDLDRYLDHALTDPPSLTRALVLARDLARDRSVLTRACGYLLDHTPDGPYGLEDVHGGLSEVLVEGALDDVTHADLTHADLTRTDLTGLRWTLHGTRWPPHIDTTQLLARSKETQPGTGIYVVLPDPTTIRNTINA